MIDSELLEKCPVLNERQKELLRRTYINGESVTGVASSWSRSKSTVSSQRKKAKADYDKWVKERTAQKGPRGKHVDFDSAVFRMLNKGKRPEEVIAKLGRADKVAELEELHKKLRRDEYWETVETLKKAGYFLKDLPESARGLIASCEVLTEALEERENELKALNRALREAGLKFERT